MMSDDTSVERGVAALSISQEEDSNLTLKPLCSGPDSALLFNFVI